MKNFNGTIGNRNRDLPACSVVPQPTALPRARSFIEVVTVYNLCFRFATLPNQLPTFLFPLALIFVLRAYCYTNSHFSSVAGKIWTDRQPRFTSPDAASWQVVL